MGTSAAASARRLKVLVEAPAPYSFSVREAAAISDCDVRLCTGPQHSRACPILSGLPCPGAEDADVIVASLGLDTEEKREILCGLKALHPGRPLVVLAWQADVDRYGEFLDGCRVITFPWTLSKLRAAIRDLSDGIARRPVSVDQL